MAFWQFFLQTHPPLAGLLLLLGLLSVSEDRDEIGLSGGKVDLSEINSCRDLLWQT